MAETCGADEIRIDASTAAAVIIRASLFMILTGGCIFLGDCYSFFAIPMTYTLPPRAISGCPSGYKERCFFSGPQPGCFFFGPVQQGECGRTSGIGGPSAR